MAAHIKYKRRQYIIAPAFQLKYVGLILALVFLTALACSYFVYYTVMLVLGDKLANVYPQGRLVSIVNMVNLRILLSMVFLIPLVFILGILASHKIAGPIYRIEKYLGSMTSGVLSEKLTLRKKDELVSLANGINLLADSVKTSIREEREHLEKSAALIDALKKIAHSKSIDHGTLENTIDKLSDEVNKANSVLGKYKI